MARALADLPGYALRRPRDTSALPAAVALLVERIGAE